jgi:hypothetical protein
VALFLAYPFHLAPHSPLVPEGLLWTVPPAAAQGYPMTGGQELVGNVYVLAGLVGLTGIAGWLARRTERRAPALAGRTAA